MLDNEAAETLMSLSAPDERKFSSPLYAHGGLPWHAAGESAGAHSGSFSKKRSFNSFDTAQTLASSLPTASFLPPPGAFSDLQRKIHERPLTSLIPRHDRHRDADDDDDEDDDDSDVDMGSSSADEDDRRAWKTSPYRSPFDGLVAAARDQEEAFSSSGSSSQPIMIPRASSNHGGRYQGEYLSGSLGKKQRWGGGSLTRVREDGAYLSTSVGSTGTHDSSPTGVEDDEEGPGAWFDPEYKQRMRLASICSSEAGSEYGGLGRKHLEEFIRMEISAANENDPRGYNGGARSLEDDASLSSPPGEGGKFIGSYSPEARRKRIERFLEKRKRRVWAKKVDYDVRKNFANSRLRVKGRFVKKEDEELLCHLLSFT